MADKFVRGDGTDATGRGDAYSDAYASVDYAYTNKAAAADRIRVCGPTNGTIVVTFDDGVAHNTSAWLQIVGCDDDGVIGGGVPRWESGTGVNGPLMETGAYSDVIHASFSDLEIDTVGEGEIFELSSSGDIDYMYFFRCDLSLGSPANTLFVNVLANSVKTVCVDCEIHDGAQDFINNGEWSGYFPVFIGCVIHDISSEFLGQSNAAEYGAMLIDCWVVNCDNAANAGFFVSNNSSGQQNNPGFMIGNSFLNVENVYYIPNSGFNQNSPPIFRNNVVRKGGADAPTTCTAFDSPGTETYFDSDQLPYVFLADYNCFSNLDAIVEAGASDLTTVWENNLSTNPSFTDETDAAFDLTPGASWTGLEGASPASFLLSRTAVTNYQDIGAVQRQAAAGGGIAKLAGPGGGLIA